MLAVSLDEVSGIIYDLPEMVARETSFPATKTIGDSGKISRDHRYNLEWGVTTPVNVLVQRLISMMIIAKRGAGKVESGISRSWEW